MSLSRLRLGWLLGVLGPVLVGLTAIGCGGDGLKVKDAGRDTAEALDLPLTPEVRDQAVTTGTGGSGGLGGMAGGGGAAGTGGLGGIIGFGGAAGTGGLGGTGAFGGTGGANALGGAVGLDGSSGDGGRGDGGLLDGAVGRDGRGGMTGTGGSIVMPPMDANCGATGVTVVREATDLLLVLDRSASMEYSIAADCTCTSSVGATVPACSDVSNCTTRWSSLASALATALSATQSIQWGLKLFSTPGLGGSCAVSSGVEVLISPDSASAIESQIASVVLGNNTPTAAAITAATAYLATIADAHSKAMLLVTDGEPNCKAGSASTIDVDGTTSAIVAAHSAGYLVYVIGIGPSVGSLESFAQAGGTGSYHPAASPEALATAVAEITNTAGTCTFRTSSAAPDPNNVAVYLDKSLLARDPSNGWSFGADSQTIVLAGIACDKIRTGAATAVRVLLGCPGMPPPPFLP